MAEVIGDERIAAVLRRFVAACDPMMTRLRDAELAVPGDDPEVDHGPRAAELAVPADDPEVDHRLLDQVKARLERVRWPGSTNWARLSVEERTHWWISRVGRVTALAASVTGLAGALGDRLPLQDILGSAGQGLLLCAIAAEHGVDDRATRVRLLAAVLFGRDLDPAVAAGSGDDAADAAVVADLTGDEPAEEPVRGRRLGLKPAARWLWRQGRTLYAIQGELEKRPHGRFYHQALGMLPVVGMAGDYLGERSALKRAAKAATRWIRRSRQANR